VADAKEIIDLCEHYNVPILVDYTRRFIPELIDLKKRYDSGEFGKLITANYTFNRGWLHTGTHLTDFHNWFFGDGNGKILEVEDVDYRIWSIDLFFEKFHWSERRIGGMPVPDYYDHHTRYVIDNAYGFLEGKEELKCTAEDGLRALEIMERLCK
jgi:predicted dehydrogenase